MMVIRGRDHDAPKVQWPQKNSFLEVAWCVVAGGGRGGACAAGMAARLLGQGGSAPIAPTPLRLTAGTS